MSREYYYYKMSTTDTINSINDLPDVLTIGEVAKTLRVSVITVKRWEKRGKIKCIRVNTRGDRRYLKKDLLDYLTNL